VVRRAGGAARVPRGSRARGTDVHKILEQEAEKLRPGESGLLALDWWNGNRSVLVDADLSGLSSG
jgi:L-ribulokinase